MPDFFERMAKTFSALILLLALSLNALARDANDVADWLCARPFVAEGVSLALARDGFFGLRIAPPGKSVQNITGLWRLASDGVDLSLLNLQDGEIKVSVGKDALHASLGKLGQVTLSPGQAQTAEFRVTGLLELDGGKAVLVDAASGRSFPVQPDPAAKGGKFAIVEVEIGRGEVKAGKMLRHSAPVPRLYERPQPVQADFASDVCKRFWLLPHIGGVEKAALRLGEPQVNHKSGDMKGSFEITGRGLRLEGSYTLAKDKLTLEASRANVRNLEIIGAGEIAKTVLGQFVWRLSPAGLELTGADKRVLLLAM